MSNTVQKGFEMNLDIKTIGAIKPVASGTFSDRSSGKEIKYKGSVSFKTINIETIDDEVLGEKEVETAFIIKIAVDADSEIRPLNEYIRVLQEREETFTLPITLPRQSDGNTYKSTCLLNSKEFILMMEKKIKSQVPKSEPKK